MSQVIHTKTSEISEDLGSLKRTFSMSTLGIHHCQPMRTRTKPELNIP